MKLSIYNRIILLIAFVGSLMILGLVLRREMDSQRLKLILEEEKEQGAGMLARVLDFKSRSLGNFSYDYTYWDEMFNFVNSLDPEWAYGNLEVSVPTFQIDYVWVYSNDLKVVYSYGIDSLNPIPEVPLFTEELRRLVSGGHTYSFYVMKDSILIQVAGGSIHPTRDEARVTPNNGYLFVGRVWTPDYLTEIEEMTETRISLLEFDPVSPQKDVIDDKQFTYSNFLPLKGYNGYPVKVVNSVKSVDLASEFSAVSIKNFRYVGLILIISLFIVSLILIRMISRPLRLLALSLKNEDPESIRKLQEDKHEFGRIATLINSFFIQKKVLLDEIEERKRIEIELIEAKEKAEESDRLKTAFLNNLSHEIRTPMNAIVGFSELIDDPRVSEEERRDFSGIIRDSSYRLLGIITDLISLSTVESGQEIVEEETFNLNRYLLQVCQDLAPSIEAKGLAFATDFALKDDHSGVMADKAKLGQILANLLKNAVKFTKTGRIDLGYTIRGGEIEFLVKDTGIGIPEDKFETVFIRFRQANDSLARSYGGAGLGLPIAKAYVEMLGGRIWIRSLEGVGSEFRFTIPYKPA